MYLQRDQKAQMPLYCTQTKCTELSELVIYIGFSSAAKFAFATYQAAAQRKTQFIKHMGAQVYAYHGTW